MNLKKCEAIETGLHVELIAHLIDQTPKGSKTTTRYYLARRIGGTPVEMGWETQGVDLVPKIVSRKLCEPNVTARSFHRHRRSWISKMPGSRIVLIGSRRQINRISNAPSGDLVQPTRPWQARRNARARSDARAIHKRKQRASWTCTTASTG
ncbi:hypothetical protein [Sinorhizobium sp. BJ1]|uniref:hypothetical protein n=1 Tax=Sinorhizobium sp. BJ1 TaxID=2035455 RepID=UPI0015CF48A8|nr:hypothetical protein [Sinorhizobium sp. BJ1]